MQVSSPTSPPPPRAVIVGAGPSGMATAIELAQSGIPSVVLEKRGAVATREPLFAVAPPFADRLAALDETGSLTRLVTPLDRIVATEATTGRDTVREFEGALAPDATRSRGDVAGLVRALDAGSGPDADRRRWGVVGIDTLENGMRELARTRYSDLIDLRTDAGVTALRQGDGWAEAVLAPDGDGAVRDAVRGAMLVDATGRDLAGGPRTTWPEQSHWLGVRREPRPDGGRTIHRLRETDPEIPGGRRLTVELPAGDRTMVWTQMPAAAAAVLPEQAHARLDAQAAAVATTADALPAARAIPVSVQLWNSDEPARGRILKVGDSVRGPYFMTSSGAATAIVHDTPRAVDAIRAVLQDGVPAEQASAGYADAVRGANAQLLALVRPRFLADLGIRPRDAAPGVSSVRPPA